MALKAARRAVATWWCAVALCQAATLVRYPYLQNVRSDRVTVIWTTREDGAATLRYSADRTLFLTATDRTRRFGTTETGMSAAYFQHQADLTGLTPGTEYSYQVVMEDETLTPAGDDLRFRTATSGPFTFLVFGDSGQGTPAQRQIAQLMMQERPAFVLHTGDIAYESGTFDQYQRNYFDYYRDLMKRAPFFTTPGNHDYATNFAAPYLAVHSPPADDVPPADRGRYYSFDWGNAHFVSLDSNMPLANAVNGTGQMLQWLESDLQKTQQAWKVVFFHHSAYPTANHEDDDISALVRNRLIPILDKYSIDLVLNGHEHSYQHTQAFRGGVGVEDRFGAVYVITGGGGAALHPVFPRPFLVFAKSAHHYMRVDVQDAQMTLRAIDSDGQEIDNFTLEPRFPLSGKPPQLSTGAVVNAASFTPALAPGTLVSIFGQNLSFRENRANRLPLPNQLGGANVSLNGRRLPLLFVSPSQINA